MIGTGITLEDPRLSKLPPPKMKLWKMRTARAKVLAQAQALIRVEVLARMQK